MRGIIIEEEYNTYLRRILESIQNRDKYNWLISSCECYPVNKKFSDMLSNEYCLLAGEELFKMVKQEDFQWVWGILSAIPKDVSEDAILKCNFPKADGNESIWQKPITIQHPLAEIEIIAWDSSMTIIKSNEERIIENIRNVYTDCYDFEEFVS